MNKNNRGFTLVEVLAVIVILGILAGVGIPMVTRYIEKTRMQSYETMEETIYDGARNFILDENIYLNNCTAGYTNLETTDNMLVDFQYVQNLTDPKDNSRSCSYNVYGCMESDDDGMSLATYKYKVELTCLKYSHCGIYTDDGKMTNCS